MKSAGFLLTFVAGNLMIAAQSALLLRYPGRRPEITTGAITALALLWSCYALAALRKRVRERAFEREAAAFLRLAA